MTETLTSNQTQDQLLKTVQIDGDKNGFNSKSAVDKFKQAVKSSNNFDLVKLSKKFIKTGYLLIEVSNTGFDYKFMITQTEKPVDSVDKPTELAATSDQKVENQQRRELLRAKINNMIQMRNNGYYHKAKASSNVPDEILSEYKKLFKVSKIPIPEPSEILANPEQYRPIVSMVLGNSMMKSLPQSHPYIKYFKLLAKQIGAEEKLPIPTQNFLNNTPSIPNNLEQMMSMAGPVTEIKSNVMSKEEDTDSEEEYIEV
jgi:hypothetical protein